MEHPITCVILPAAGVGERMGIVTPKQFCNVLCRPLISYTIESFQRIPWIHHIIVSISPDRISYMQQVLMDFSHVKTTIVTGSSSRHRSICSGINALSSVCPDTEVVVIHDAVRPFVDEDTISAVTFAALSFGAAGAVRPLVSTIVAADDNGFMQHSLDRSKYRASEMPQAFRYSVIKLAYEKSTDYDMDYGTECLHLAQQYADAKVRLIEGPDNLWKVTHRKDLFAVESLLKESIKEVNVIHTSEIECVELTKAISHCLISRLHQPVPLQSFTLDDYRQQFAQVLSCACHTSYSSNIFLYTDIEALMSLGTSWQYMESCAVIVHVVLLGGTDVDRLHLMDLIKRCSDAVSKIPVVAGVILKGDDQSASRAADLIASLIIERNTSFKGQTFWCI